MSEMKLTIAQEKLLRRMVNPWVESDLVNGDECLPSWWIRNGFAVNANTARALARTKYVEFYRHEGGQPGVDSYRVTDAGRAALRPMESRDG